MKRRQTGVKALTLVELMIIIAVVAVMIGSVLLPELARTRGGSYRLNCINNQMQVGVAFRTWALDNRDRYPMQVSVTNGGTMEAVSSGVAFVHFQGFCKGFCVSGFLFGFSFLLL